VAAPSLRSPRTDARKHQRMIVSRCQAECKGKRVHTVSGVFSEDLSTTVQPDARAGATCGVRPTIHARSFSGA
jgi:hypothetical protein